MAGKNFFSGLGYLVLLMIQRLDGTGYGVSIHLQLCELTGEQLAYGAIYKVLKTLSAKNYITPSKGEPTRERGGRAKTFYRITRTGLQALEDFETHITRIKRDTPITRLNGGNNATWKETGQKQ